MECAAKPLSKPSSNISGIVSKFAKVWGFRSIGVFCTENHSQHHPNNGSLTEDSSIATEEECDAEKVHPQPLEIQHQSSQCFHVQIMSLFRTISTLKSSYVTLQEAHIPYDSEKIKAADELFMAQLESLWRIKCIYKEKSFKEVDSVSVQSALLLTEIQLHEKLLGKLKFQLKMKNTKMVNLLQELQELDLRNRELGEEFRKKERENMNGCNFSSIQDVFKAASKAIHDFAKPLISLMKASDWDLDQAAESIEASIVYFKRSHKKYAFESYIARKMFHGMPLESCSADSILEWGNSIDALMTDSHLCFANFCKTKYLSMIHPTMEASFFGNLDHRKFVSGGMHPRTPFYEAFVKMAKWVWVLLEIAASSELKVEMYTIEKGIEFSDVCMDSVEEVKKDIIVSDEGIPGFKVEFMVMPGFKIGGTLIKSRVYLSSLKSSHRKF